MFRRYTIKMPTTSESADFKRYDLLTLNAYDSKTVTASLFWH